MFRSLNDFVHGATIETDIAIIGAGAAGITIAREFVGRSREVWLIESGGFNLDGETQELYRGDEIGEPYYALDMCRLRFFGGTTNHWGGHCRPLDPIDFERRSWIPYSGWPIGRKDLDPFYARAQEVCQLGPYCYEPEEWPALKGRLIDLAPDKMLNRLWQFSPPTRFGQVYRAELKAARNVHTLLHANAVDIALNGSARAVESVALKTLSGKAATLRPKVLIVACGGIENPRLLLSCDSVARNGIGNDHDLVGRFFMEHPAAEAAFAVRNVDLKRFSSYYDVVKIGSTLIRAKPGLPEAIQRRHHTLNGCFDVGYGFDRSTGFMAFRKIGKAAADGRLPDHFGSDLLDVLADLDGTVSGIYRDMRHEMVLWFGTDFEQTPNPASRVTLERERDVLGMRKARLDWRLTDRDTSGIALACRLLGEELARLGLARMRLEAWLLGDAPSWPGLEGQYHHMGTTRMSDDPHRGVVDRHCRVHGIDNLYIAGSSVFPTSGYANPTLTICALAIRLSDHLKLERRS